MSHSGYDDSKCGVNHHPCRTLSYTLEKKAKADDIIQINGQDGIPYPMKKQHLVLANITLIGTEGRAKIVGELSVVDSCLFADVARGSSTSQEQVSINLVNLKLIRIGIIKLKNTLTTLNVQVVNCTVLKLSKSPIVDSSAAKTTVIFRRSIIHQVSKGLQVKSREFSLSIESSKINNLGRSYPERDCPQFIVAHGFESFVACFRKSTFKFTFLIDLGVSNQKKSNVSIIDSIFDDDSENIKHDGCFSGITLRNTTALIVNSSFTNIISRNSLIKAIASFMTFKECIFSNISSRLGIFSLSSSITASCNKTNAIHSKLNGYNHGSVYLQSTESIFQNCTFHNNTVNGQYGSGGALYVSNSDITVQQSLFKENTATYSGGAIQMEKTRSSFVNCTFERNSVQNRPQNYDFGGAISAAFNSHLTMHQCSFKENTATGIGGATYIHKSQSLFERCIFERNTVKSLPDKKTSGGAIASFDRSDITVQQSLFKENTATYSGGAIKMEEARSSFVNCTFERNSVKSRPQNYDFGGAISATFNSHLTMHQCIFKENTATGIGGAISIQQSQSLFERCIFERNTVKSLPDKKTSGGAIASVDRSDITVQQSLFKENTATYSGGAIQMEEARSSFVNCTFERNSVQNRPQNYEFGGAICALFNSHLTMHQCNFKENTATGIGGAISIQQSQSLFERCIFERNTVKSLPDKQVYGGGAIASTDRSDITVQQSLFKENTATYNGGAIQMEEARGSFVNCTFERNSVKSRPQNYDFGGAICATFNSHLTMHQCSFKENTATGIGGATYIHKSQSLFERCIFERNTVKSLPDKKTFGGAIASVDRSDMTVQQSLFKENTATYNGGAIKMEKTRSSFVNCTFERNSVQNRPQNYDFGGAICATFNSHLTMHQCNFKENTATGVGGAISIQQSQSLFERCIFERNTVKSLPDKQADGGGAIASTDRSDITVQQSLFKENTATYIGGAIKLEKTRSSFVNCTFERNSVKGRPENDAFGGAICALFNSHLTMHQCSFKENSATGNGGATGIQDSQSSFDNCIFEGKV